MVDLKSRGPWHVVFEKETGAFFIAEELCPLAGVNWDDAGGLYDEPSSWDWETARLMAAAPDLLEALRMMLNVPEGGFMSEKLAAEDVACKAIERATGEE